MQRHVSYFLACVLLMLGASSALAQTVFSYEAGEPGMPYHGNPGTYVVGSSTTTGVTDGLQSMAVTANVITFGGPQSSALTDAGRVALLNAGTDVLVDLTVPANVPSFGFGNVDLHFFQGANADPALQDQETHFSGTFALTAPGGTVTLDIPISGGLVTGGNGSGHLQLDPTLPWAYQFDFSFNTATNPPFTFNFDNMRVIGVPEPTSMAVLALCGGALIRRRRR